MRLWTISAIIGAVILGVAACGGQAPTPAPTLPPTSVTRSTIEAAVAATATVAPTATASAAPAATAVPPAAVGETVSCESREEAIVQLQRLQDRERAQGGAPGTRKLFSDAGSAIQEEDLEQACDLMDEIVLLLDSGGSGPSGPGTGEGSPPATAAPPPQAPGVTSAPTSTPVPTTRPTPTAVPVPTPAAAQVPTATSTPRPTTSSTPAPAPTPTPTQTPTPTSSDEHISFMTAAFAPYGNVSTRFDGTYFYVESNSIPDHQMMVGIRTWNAQVPIPVSYTGTNAWSIPLQTQYAENPLSIENNFQRGAIAIAVNGVPIFNPTNASGEHAEDLGELDNFGGHSGGAEDYHYHTAPLHLESTSGTKPIAYALDGFAIYGSLELDGSPMEPLDQYHGHEAADGSYHYHGTDEYPYLIAAMRGEVTLDDEFPAPRTQIEPQPLATPIRPPQPRLDYDDLIITALTANDACNGYLLEYTIGGVLASVEYSWTVSGLFTYVYNEVDGTTTSETIQRKEPMPSAADGCGQSTGQGSTDGSDAESVADTIVLSSTAIENGVLMDAFTCETRSREGIEESIPLSWSNVPSDAQSLAIIMHHFPDPNDTDPARASYYLLLWAIDPSVTEIAHGGADDGDWYMGSNKDGNVISYTSPCSQGVGTHEYTITIYALSETPATLPKANSLDVNSSVLLSAIETVTVLAKGTLTFDDVN